MSVIDLFGRISGIVACILLTYFYSLRGFFSGLLIGDVVLLILYFNVDRNIPAFKISFPVINRLIKIGLPIMVAGFLIMFLGNIDKIMILKYFSEKALGLYGISSFVFMVLGMFPSKLYQVTLPYIMEEYGSTSDIQQIKNYFIEPTVLLAYLPPFLICGIYFGVHIPIKYYLGKYIPSIVVVQIMSFGYFFMILNTMATSICFAVNKQMKILYLTLPCIFINAMLNYILIRNGMGINGVAVGTAITYFLYNISILILTMKQYEARYSKRLKFLLMIYSPFIYALILMLSMDFMFQMKVVNIWHDAIYTSIKIGIFCILYSLVFIFIRKQTAVQKLSKNIKELLKTKTRRFCRI